MRSYALSPLFQLSRLTARRQAFIAAERQREAHPGPARAPIICLNSSAVLLDDLLHDSQPKSGAFRLARYIRIKYGANQFPLKSGAVVRHLNRGDGGLAAPADPRLDVDARVRAAFQRLKRVRDQVIEYLAYTHPVGPDLRQIDRQ